MSSPRPTLLIVDDEPEMLRSVHDLLRLEYRVITSETGAQAMRILDGPGSIHVVLSDQRMPGVSGVEVLRHAREVRPETTRLLFTAYADNRAVIEAINQASVFRYITKPWDPDELLMTIRQAVEQHDLLAEKSRLVRELQESNRRLLEGNRLKESFIEVASHELNTPVAVILGMAELWKMSQSERASPTERAWIDRIQAAGKRLAATVERMLKLIRTGELNPTLSLHVVDLESTVRSVLAELQPYVTARAQTIHLELDPALGTAEADPAKLADILSNLLINAVKFSPDGGTIVVNAAPLDAELVRFEVTDSGIGIEAADRAHLFEPFFTGFDTMHHSSGEYQYCKKGLGLGLCLVKSFVDLHGGTVEVSSAPGEGSTFAFTLPRRCGTAIAAVAHGPVEDPVSTGIVGC